MKQSAPTVQMRRRLLIVVAMVTIVGFGILILRLYNLQVIDPDNYQQRAIDQQLQSVSISAKRGSILDRNNKTLAQSATVWNVFVAPAEIETAEEAELMATELSALLDLDKQKILERCEKKGSYYEIVKSKVEKDEADEVLKLITEKNLVGVHIEEDTKRYYPYGSLASTLLGFTNAYDNTGSMGIEAYYDRYLSGTPGMVVSLKNAKSTDMPSRFQQRYDAKDGDSVVLTIDETIQHFVEKNLETAVVEHGIKNRAVGIVMDVNTGEILAMATKPDFDPNNPREIKDPKALERLAGLDPDSDAYKTQLEKEQYAQWRNKAISDPYEPGSVFKIVTVAGALENGVVDLNDTFTCTGAIQVASELIHCWKLAGHGTQNLTETVMHSCNPAFIMIGQRLGGAAFYDNFEAFGLTEKTGIDLPGEAGNKSLYHERDRLINNVVELSSSSFGQTFKVTPIQMITAVSAAVNGGKLMQPQVIKQIVDSEGRVVENFEPVMVRQVISEETSDTVRYLIDQVVNAPGGSGGSARVPGYRIGGKTGTSEKLDLATDENDHVLSFVGVAPIDDPQIAVLVVLDSPELENVFGSVIAAPVVGAILADTLPYLGIEPKYTAEELAELDVNMPNVTGIIAHDAQSQLRNMGLESRVIGDGANIVAQVPTEGAAVPKGSTVLLYTEGAQMEAQVAVPDVIGRPGLEANQTIVNAGLNIKLTGADIDGESVVAYHQSPEPGTMVDKGTVVTVEFINADNIDIDPTEQE